MANELFVTLKKGDNKYLNYPCKGWLELFELGVDGSVISGVWRGVQADGSTACPVEVRDFEFEYAGGQFRELRRKEVATQNIARRKALDAIDGQENGMKAAFEAKYERDWNDPSGDDMKAVWADAWTAARAFA